jgi:hypothetical protein
MAQTSEELMIFRIQNEIRGLRMKTKTLDETSVPSRLIRLKKLNPNMADDLENQYLHVLKRVRDDEETKAQKEFRKNY